MKCDNCNNTATVHLTEIKNGKKLEKHLCEQCAAKIEGLSLKSHTPINELLTNFVLAHSGAAQQKTPVCEQCGISWVEFRQSGLLGCEKDYDHFDGELTAMAQRMHDGATHHIGKQPKRRRSGSAAPMASHLAKLKRELAKAVEVEDYERAAMLRDEIRHLEAMS